MDNITLMEESIKNSDEWMSIKQSKKFNVDILSYNIKYGNASEDEFLPIIDELMDDIQIINQMLMFEDEVFVSIS